MAKYLLIVAVVISLATAGLGFVNHGTLVSTKEELASTQSTLQSTAGKLTASQKELATTKASLDSTTAQQVKTTADLATIQSELATSKKAADDAQASVTAKEGEIATLTTENNDLKTRLAGGPTTNATTGEVVEDPRIKELEAVVASQKEKMAQTDTEITNFRKEADLRRTKQMQQGLEGRVLAVNPAWNFVVLSIGDKQGVVNNAELLLKRGGQYLGKVRVTSVEPATSVADIVANTLPSGVAVQPGDSVIFQSTEN